MKKKKTKKVYTSTNRQQGKSAFASQFERPFGIYTCPSYPYGVPSPKTTEEKLQDLTELVDRLGTQVDDLAASKADKPVYNEGDWKIVPDTESEYWDYEVWRYEGGHWSWRNGFLFKWTARRWIRKQAGELAVIREDV